MSKLKIITVPDKVLREKSCEITKVDKHIKRLISELKKAFSDSEGIGIAAPQVGKPLRLVMVELKGGKRKNGEEMPVVPLNVLINPKIIKCSEKKTKGEEGCLSVPGVWGEVERFEEVVVEAIDETGKGKTIKASGLFARVLQHEIDHLDGILFTDRADYSTLHRIGPKGEKIPLDL